MNDVLQQLRDFVALGQWGYHPTGPKAAEPAAFAALALCANDMHQEAATLSSWLAELQAPTGAVGVMKDQDTPAWPTSLAMLAWRAHDQATATARFEQACRRALDWTLQTQGKVLPKRRQIGHDTTLLGWSWAENTHSWLEPTCFFVLALNAMGQQQHPRTRSGVQMIVDRLHQTGGCNYGNTIVLGQSTLPHILPTGLAMLALADHAPTDPRMERSLEYLERVITEPAATTSLCYALLGLTAHGRRPPNTAVLLQNAFQSDADQQSHNCLKMALLCLTSRPDLDWLPEPVAQPALSATNT